MGDGNKSPYIDQSNRQLIRSAMVALRVQLQIFALSNVFLQVLAGNFGSKGAKSEEPGESEPCGQPVHGMRKEVTAKRENILPLSEPWLISMRENASVETHYGDAVLISAHDDYDRTDVAVTSALNCATFNKELKHVAFVGLNFIEVPRLDGMSPPDSPRTPSGTGTPSSRSKSRKPNTQVRITGGSTVGIKKCIPHEDHSGYNNDIALILLEKPVKYSETIKPICQPENGEDMKVNDLASLAGQGTENENVPTKVPKQMWLQATDLSVCEKNYRGINNDVICVKRAHSDGPAFHRGDYGGPLVKEINGRYVMVALASESKPVMKIHKSKSSSEAKATTQKSKLFSEAKGMTQKSKSSRIASTSKQRQSEISQEENANIVEQPYIGLATRVSSHTGWIQKMIKRHSLIWEHIKKRAKKASK